MNKPKYNRIKAVLAENEKTSKWLSSAIGIYINTISKWCRNDMQPRVENLSRKPENV
jgi:putative transcriptional regulator